MKKPPKGHKWKEKKNEKWNDPKESKLRIEWDPRVKDWKVYHMKTPNGEYIWVRASIIQWKPENDIAMCDCV